MATQLVDNFIPSVQMGDRGWERPMYQGGISEQINDRNFAGLRRVYQDNRGRPSVTVNLGRYTIEKGQRVPLKESITLNDLYNKYGMQSPVFNATALRKEEWIELDRVVLRAARYRLRAWADLSAANTFGGFNGMAKMMLEHETMSDPGEAMVDMDAMTEGRTDAPKFQLEGLPLPITHTDFWFSARKLAISRNSGTPLDTTMGDAAGRRVAETIEKTTIGNQSGITYGGNSTQVGGYGRTSSVYGYTNFSARLTKTNLTAPTAGGWTSATTLADFISCRQQLYNNKFYGPFMVYHSNDWDTYLDNDYYVSITSGAVAPTKTLRERLKAIDGIMDVRRLDMLFATAPSASTGPGGENLTSGGGGSNGGNPFTLLFVQMTPDVARAVNGMDITTVQWESMGGMRLNFKVMCIQVPQLRADIYGNAGILHATTA
jgi:uncharacterized protein DUF6260